MRPVDGRVSELRSEQRVRVARRRRREGRGQSFFETRRRPIERVAIKRLVPQVRRHGLVEGEITLVYKLRATNTEEEDNGPLASHARRVLNVEVLVDAVNERKADVFFYDELADAAAREADERTRDFRRELAGYSR